MEVMQDAAVRHRAETLSDLMLKLMWTCQRKQEGIAGDADLSLSEFKCLRAFRHDTELSVGEIATRMSLTSSRLTRIIDGLVRKRYVTRHIDPSDRRIINVRLTKQGEAIGRKVSAECIDVYESALTCLSEEKHATIIGSLLDLSDALDRGNHCDIQQA
ncbi:MAG: MarR family transcriptional regulator [Bacteroidia bacterium]|nr:MarR family transcriptional regulator [Bacteroidia bacterium]